MKSLYGSPLRVYLVLGLLALFGVYSGLHLPISLFPVAHHPEVVAHIGLGSYSAEEFLNTHGKDLEQRLSNLQAEGVSVEKVEANYTGADATYQITFHWGTKPADALRETQTLVTAFSARFPLESRDSTWVWMKNQNSGFLAISLYSEKRSLDELYALLEPQLGPKLAAVADAQNPGLWNPLSQEIRIELKPESLAALQLFPRQIQGALHSALSGRTGGEITLGDQTLSIEMPRQIHSLAALSEVAIATPSGQVVTLSEIAHLDRGPKTSNRQSFRTGGVPSLILWAAPKPGGNVKRMSEQIVSIVQSTLRDAPADIHYSTLVDPSEFIRASVRNVAFEVALAALLAVAVLYVFIGSPRNILTAAIEIPLSIVLAFILMRLFGLNLNLISLGGLALSAGMNVDASVVVLENIFRHFEKSSSPLSFQEKLATIQEAVNEVRLPIIASTLISLIVFLPLAVTSGLSQGILGDLALAVVFSHGFSAVVALILVPTIRLHLMSKGDSHPSASPFENAIRRIEAKYVICLTAFLHNRKLKRSTLATLPLVLLVLCLWVFPRLPKELIGTPDSDWLVLSLSTDGNTLLQQMESLTEQTERELINKFGQEISYTFTQSHGPNYGKIMARLKNRKRVGELWKAIESRFPPTPQIQYSVRPWNPSELPIPDPPHFLLKVRGSDPEQRRLVAKALQDSLRDSKTFPDVSTSPSPSPEYSIRLAPSPSQLDALRQTASTFLLEDLADLTRVATTGRWAGNLPRDLETEEILFYFPPKYVNSVEDLGAIPVGVAGKVLPLRAVTDVKRLPSPPRILREDGRPLFRLTARMNRGDETKARAAAETAKTQVEAWLQKHPDLAKTVSVEFEDPAPEVTDAIHQLGKATALSLLLIFVTLVFQFGTLIEPLLVMVALPLGYIGVLASLWVTGSTLSLNSVLGVILLNGIAVANSILLVDFAKRLAATGLEPRDATIKAAAVRLRPILITSLTTILGMAPLALGMGEGGKILQPLGITVAGGMWVSVLLTLFIVPCLHTFYLEGKLRAKKVFPAYRAASASALVLFAVLTFPFTAAGAIPFSQAVLDIVERNPEVAQQKVQIDIVEGRNLPTRLALLPNLFLQARQDNREEFGLDAARTGLAATLDLNLFRFGSDISGMRAASREAKAAIAQFEATKIRVESLAVEGLTEWLLYSKEKEIMDRLAGLRENLLAIAKKRFDRGLIPKQEVDKLEIDWENDRALLRDSETGFLRASARVVELLGHQDIETDWPWIQHLTLEKISKASGELPELKNRPDWQAAEYALSGAQARKSQAWGKLFPSLDLSLSYGIYYAHTRAESVRRPEYSASIVLSVPLFDRLANYGYFEVQSNTAKASELELEKIRRQARREWDAARGALPLAIESALARQTTLVVSRRLYQDALKRFERGLTEANDLNVDQQRLLQSEQLAVRGWATAHTTLANLCFARGLGTRACLEQ